jgi:hypothetical protein
MKRDEKQTPPSAALTQKKATPRIGTGKGEFTIPDSFFEPMPDEWLKAFYEGPIFPAESVESPAKNRVTASTPKYKFGK